MAARNGRLSLAAVLAVTVAVMFHSAAEAATYVVGDAMGWVVPDDDDAYDNWAFGKNFTVGDVLVFNFVTGRSDVAQVSEHGEDECIGASPIRRATAGPANMTLTAAGKNYFISTIAGQCDSGQRLEINVLHGARTLAPAAPRKAVTHVVGGAMGWVIPPGNSDDAYEAWAFGKTFYVGDVLVFNFTTGKQDVAQVTEDASDDCIGTSPIRKATAGPAKMILTTAGTTYFISTLAGHCNAGQKLDINVLPAPLAPAPAISPAPAPTTHSPAKSPAPATHSPAKSPAPARHPRVKSPAPVTGTAANSPATPTGASALSPPPSGGSAAATPASSSAQPVGAAGVFAALLTVGVVLLV